MLAAIVSSHSQSTNYFIMPHTTHRNNYVKFSIKDSPKLNVFHYYLWGCFISLWTQYIFCPKNEIPYYLRNCQYSNSINLQHTGMGMCWIIKYSRFIRQYLKWPKFLQVILCYSSYPRGPQLIRGVFHSDIPFTCWFRVSRVLFGVF